MTDIAKPTPPASSGTEPPKSWIERFRERVNGHWLMQEGRLPSIGRELAYAVEDIRHKVVEEGMFGRQVTPSTFPREDPAPTLTPKKVPPGIHGEQATDKASGGPDVHGNGGPSGSNPLSADEKQARQEKFRAMCREVAARHPARDPGIDRSPGIAPSR